MGIMGGYVPDESKGGKSIPAGNYRLFVTECKMTKAGTGREGVSFTLKTQTDDTMYDTVYKNSIFNSVITNRLKGFGIDPARVDPNISDADLCRLFFGRSGVAYCEPMDNGKGQMYTKPKYYYTDGAPQNLGPAPGAAAPQSAAPKAAKPDTSANGEVPTDFPDDIPF